MARKNKFMSKITASALLVALMTGGVVLYPDLVTAAPKDAKTVQTSTAAVAAIKTLLTQISQATGEELRSPLRLKLVDAYMEHGRPLEAAAELQVWLKNNSKAPERERALLTLINAQRQSNDWDGAASVSRTFIREYPKSASLESTFSGLVEIARYGQASPVSEASALGDWVAANPNDAANAGRMLRQARLQEQSGAVAEAIATLRKFTAKYPKDPAAGDASWRAIYLTHDRLRRSAEAFEAGKIFLNANPKRPNSSKEWQWLGDLARSMDNHQEAIQAFKKALAADPTNRELINQFQDSLWRTGNIPEMSALSDFMTKNLPWDSQNWNLRLALANKSLDADGKKNGPAVQAEMLSLIDKGVRPGDAAGIYERASLALGIDPKVITETLKGKYAQAKREGRRELAERITELLRRTQGATITQAFIETELKENPLNNGNLVRTYVEMSVNDQIWETNEKKRTKYELDGTIKKIAEIIKPYAYLPELRKGMEQAGDALQRTKQKELTVVLRQQIEMLSQTELAIQVDIAYREARRDWKKATDALTILLKESKTNPAVFTTLGHDTMWTLLERTPPEGVDKVLAWWGAQADSRPDDIWFNNMVGDAFRRYKKFPEAVVFYARGSTGTVTIENSQNYSQALGSLIDVYSYELKKNDEAEKLIVNFDRNATSYSPQARQERYRQFGDFYGRLNARDKQINYYRKAAELGMSNTGYDSVKNLMIVLPPAESVAYGQKLLADAAYDKWSPEIGLMVAHRQATGLKDMAAAVDTLALANEKRLTTGTFDMDNWGTFRELVSMGLDLADPKRVTDPKRKEMLTGIKPLEPAKLDQLLALGMQWLGSQQMHEVAREIIRRAGTSGERGAQLDIFSQILARTKANDGWHWDRNMEIINDEVARGNEGTASTMLRLLLKQSSGYNEAARSAARSLLLNTYKKFGEDLLAVDDKSPIAPLLKGASYLRLGEEKTAWEMYQKNAELFAQKIDEIPSEYVLYIGNELATGSDADRDVAEQLLRTWLARADKIQGLEGSVKAAVQLKLADVFYYGRRFDVARAEYQSVMDKYPETAQAIEAQFRIGESFMYQKNYVEATKVFEKLRKNKDTDIAIRATFMQGVLQYETNAREEARETFKAVLDLSPSEEIASKTLFQLALIYGDDNRFKEMLDMLSAIGNYGREAKRWHSPGKPLTVLIHDPDMAIVQDARSVPVLVTTSNGDRELITLVSGAAGKGFFQADLPTTLGASKPNDGTLQLLGSDIITYDYPDDFKAKFKYVPPPQGNIRIAADATFAVSNAHIQEESKRSALQRADKDGKIQRLSDEAKEFRANNEIKPGNPLYVRIVDPDRSTNVGVNRVEVVARAGTGDTVRMWVNETSANTGIFEGMIKTAERPAEAIASDSSLGKLPGLATDKDTASAWESQHDGQPGKWLAADLKDVFSIKQFAFSMPDDKQLAAARFTIESSNNGTLWTPVLTQDKGKIAHGLTLNYGPMRHKHYAWSKEKAKFADAKAPEDLTSYINTVATAKVASLDASAVNTMALPAVGTDTEADVHSLVGYFFVNKTGVQTFHAITGDNGSAALVIDGRVIAADKKGFSEWGVGVELTRGWHHFAGFITLRGAYTDRSKPAGFRCTPIDTWGVDQAMQYATAQRGGENEPMPVPSLISVPAEGKLKVEGATLTADFSAAPIPGRLFRVRFEKYSGDFVSVSNLQVTGADGKLLLPAEGSVVSLADDDVLQVSPGEDISVSYADQVNTRTPGEARALSGKLKATYYNAKIAAIAYEVKSTTEGVERRIKELYRIDPGDRIIAHITDYDEDTSPEINKLQFKVRSESGAEVALEATETDATSGIFTKEIETGEGLGKLSVKPGERIYLIYTDRQNTQPGSRTDRVAELSVVKPTDGLVNILPTRAELPPPPKKDAAPVFATGDGVTIGEPRIIYLKPEPGKPARVVLAAPLTVEVIDQDAAKDSHSTVVVEITTSSGAKLKLPLELSDQTSQGSWGHGSAMADGRFVGQALLVLGKPDENGKSNTSVSVERARRLLGAWRYSDGDNANSDAGSVKAPVLPILGSDTITAVYNDKRSTSGDNQERKSEGRMVTDATLTNLDRGFLEPVATIHLGEKLYLRVEDADRDTTAEQDEVTVTLTSNAGEKLDITLKETLGHSGTFTAEVPTHHATKPDPANGTLDTNFGDSLSLAYVDDSHTQSMSPIERKLSIQVALGADAAMAAFTKQFGSEEIAVETQFKLAECYFEIFKSQNQIKATAEARVALESGRAILATVRDNYRGSGYEARVLYLLGGFHQELKELDQAIECYNGIIRSHSNNAFAPDAQYKLAQCFEDKNEMDRASEEYVRLAYTYPDNPLIAKCMVRLNDYFFKINKFQVAANICGQFLEQYGEHELAPKIAFRQGQCYFKAAETPVREGEPKTDPKANYFLAAKAFDVLVERYTDSDLRPDAMFWAGRAYHEAGEEALAYRRYRRVTWDFPDSDAARYARGQLTLPAMLNAAKDDSGSK